MSAQILNGRVVRDALVNDLAKTISGLIKPPVLAIIQAGNNEDTNAYIEQKKSFGEKIGVKVRHIRLPESVSEEEIIARVWECNEDESIKGIIVQLPLPMTIDPDAVIEAMSPAKDVDGLTSRNVKLWLEGREAGVLPATTRGVKELLDYYKVDLFGKRVVVVGRSMLVGKPLFAYALNENASVTVCHSKTALLHEQTKKADVLIVAAGRPGLIGPDHVREGAVVIDVGINTVKGEKLEDEIPTRKLVGDVDFDKVKEIASAITPVPGGVGPMTVLALFENLADLCLKR